MVDGQKGMKQLKGSRRYGRKVRGGLSEVVTSVQTHEGSEGTSPVGWGDENSRPDNGSGAEISYVYRMVKQPIWLELSQPGEQHVGRSQVTFNSSSQSWSHVQIF